MPAAIVKEGHFPHKSVVTDRIVYVTNAQSRIVSRVAHLPTPWHALEQLELDTLPLISRQLQPVWLLARLVPEPVGPVSDARAAVEIALSSVNAQLGDEAVLHSAVGAFPLIQVGLVTGVSLVAALDKQ